jgi:uncharacterized protein (DUF1330 family)
MAKGYWVVRIDIKDQAAYDRYRASNGPAFHKYGARFLVRGGQYVAVEGTARARNVVIEFPSLEAAKECHASPEYQAAAAHRAGAVDIDVIIIEGYDGPQP